MNKNQKRILIYCFIALGAAVLAGSGVYIWQHQKIKEWEGVTDTLNERIAFLEDSAREVSGESATSTPSNWFHAVGDTQYVGEADVGGQYFLSGKDHDVCFLPDDTYLQFLPASDRVKIFCFEITKDNSREKLVQTLFGMSMEDALKHIKEYSVPDVSRHATLKIRNYKIGAFKTGIETAHADFVAVVNRK